MKVSSAWKHPQWIQVLRMYREYAHRVNQFPNPRIAHVELEKTKTILRARADKAETSDELLISEAKRSRAYLRYAFQEAERTVQLAKYRHLKRTYYDKKT